MKCYSYVRFSSKAQADGKSIKRQVEGAQRFAKKMNWKLDESMSMYDLGLSGFHATHKEKGELGVFLQAVKENKIETPSALLVESLDRLSRQKVMKALQQFLDIITAGITVVTLLDNQIYTEESINENYTQLLISLSIMFRAYEESKTKQERRTYTWDKAKEEARKGKKIKARHAAWLRLDEDNNMFLEIPEHVESIKRIFELYLQGHGIFTIAKIMNQEKRKTFNERTPGWAVSTVTRLLQTRAVIGEIQFMKTLEIKNGTREMIEDGRPVKDYYPAVINEDTFYAVQELKKSKGGKFGKIGKMKNIFSLKAKCGYCGSNMSYSTRGRNKIEYLYCSSAKRGTCTLKQLFSFRYDHLEEAFMNSCKRLELQDIVSDKRSNIQQKISNIQAQVITINNKVEESKENINKLTKALKLGNDDTIIFFTESINEEFISQKELKIQKDHVLEELQSCENLYDSTEQSLETLKKVIKQMNSKDEETRLEVRRKLQKSIRLLVDEIKLYSVGKHYKILIEDDQEYAESKGFAISQIGVANHSRRMSTFREVEIFFKGGGEIKFVHDGNTGGLHKITEIDENSMLTQDTIDQIGLNLNISDEVKDILRKNKFN